MISKITGTIPDNHAVEKTVPLKDCSPWANNPRTVKKADFDRLLKQILELGIYKRLLCTTDLEQPGKYIILGGNTRFLALGHLGQSEAKITVVCADTEELRLKYALSDNDQVGETDEGALAEITYPLRDKIELDNYRINIGKSVSLERVLTGFGPDIESTTEDKLPPAEESESNIRPGDLFMLGRHKVICGDCREPWIYAALLGDEKADLIFTDPPWNVDYTGQHCSDRPHYEGDIHNDNMAPETFIEFSEIFMERIRDAAKPGAAFYICSGYASYIPFVWAIRKSGMVFKNPIIWVKDNWTIGWEDYKKQHEMILSGKKPIRRAQPILYGWNGGRHYFAEDVFEADVWVIKKRTGEMMHPTQKPLALIQRAIRNSSRMDEIVLDIFAGSGSTLIAAERERRVARLIESNPKHIETIIKRYAALGAEGAQEIKTNAVHFEEPPDAKRYYSTGREDTTGKPALDAGTDAEGAKGLNPDRPGPASPLKPQKKGHG